MTAWGEAAQELVPRTAPVACDAVTPVTGFEGWGRRAARGYVTVFHEAGAEPLLVELLRSQDGVHVDAGKAAADLPVGGSVILAFDLAARLYQIVVTGTGSVSYQVDGVVRW